ncbi:putative peptide zinc metalloprotease protein [Saccharothrix australiensis]|uniref:Putative peptide zinc metalloprotease protein n=1 Tax=Saccharothrix australiensis TaxID=2072 RepID=A0A495VWG2_9PSEU|nr:putative peptide zinc metalloprotease protein [Saccharothrix australiensis]
MNASGEGTAGRGATTAPASDVPHRARGVELIGELRDSGYRRPPALVRRADGQVLQLTPLLYRVLAAVDGRADHAGIAAAVGRAVGRRVTADDVRVLLATKLAPLGVLRLPDGTEPEHRKAEPLLGLRLRHVVADPAVTRRITAPFARLFHPAVVVAALVAFAAVATWVLFHEGLAGATHQAFHQPALLLLVFAVTVVSAGCHEFGHAAAARYGGATPGAMGFGLYLLWPAFYTDVTDSYRLGRAGRLRTDLGGLYFNALVAVAVHVAWWVSGWDALLLVVATQIAQMLRQLAPVVRYDGYHVLADLTGVPDLFRHIKPTLLGLLPHRWGRPESKVLKPWARAVVTAWVLLVVPLLLAGTALLVLALPRVVATAWQGVGEQWRSAGAALGDGDLALVLVRVLSVAAIALPVLGVGLLLVRLARRVCARVWRSTGGRPGRRALVVVCGLAVLAGLLWAWWPQPDRYRPVRPDERGTVVDAVPGAVGAAAGSGRATPAPGEARAARTAWPSGTPLPTREKPVLALVLAPADGAAGEPTLVFPLDLPAPPGPGDNQALAVNTVDGSVRYEVSFALVWETDGVVDNRNEAYALASCRDCTTVAVAFQVVLVVGQADVVVPENIAVAVNHSCVRCVTYALAAQLVVSLPEDLSPRAKARLEEVWAELARLARDVPGMTVQQVQQALEGAKARILGVLREEGVPLPGGSTTTPPATTPPATTSGPVPTSSPGRTSESPTGTTSAPPSSTAPDSPTPGSPSPGSPSPGPSPGSPAPSTTTVPATPSESPPGPPSSR